MSFNYNGARHLFCAVLLAGFFVNPLSAMDTDHLVISDDVALRRSLSAWFTEAPMNIVGKPAYKTKLDSGESVQVSIENGSVQDEFAIVLGRALNGKYPGWAQGSWIILRSSKTGDVLRVRIFLRSDPYTYIQFSPQNDKKSYLDMVIYNANMAQSVSIPISINRILTSSLDDILQTVSERVPLKYFTPHADNYRDIISLIAKIRNSLAQLEYADDGAINENGDYVFIETLQKQEKSAGLNCSGFAKWTVDGILKPVTGSRLGINELKQHYGERGSAFTDVYEDLRDPFFGLDWNRNLASNVYSILKSSHAANLDEFEVRKSPFASTIVRSGGTAAIRPYNGFLPNAGYDFEGLQALLYALAIDEPGNIYLGAVNKEMLPKPRMRQYYHTAVLIPYFDDEGTFHITVFESASETNFNRFKNRYPANQINLVRIPVEGNFEPN
ncbi:MAG: hypothetical protein Ta2F_10020 [Termitinemataceae bacterium]|nr:MAG: hypothetical protein Ta2F_10020 [Termitinemataceae bacterium]